MDTMFVGIPVTTWALACSAAGSVLVLVPSLRKVLRRRLRPREAAPDGWRTLIDGLNTRWLGATTLALALAAAAVLLTTEPRVVQSVRTALVVVLTIQIARYIPMVLDWGLARIARRRGDPEGGDVAGTLVALRWVLLVAANVLLLLLAIQNLGVDVTSLVAGLGIGGIAVALAIQNILGDLFASLTIALDRPFVLGDFIVVGSEMGTVEHIGLKTTRVRSLSGEQLVFGNADLLGSRIRNYKRMSERRTVLSVRVARSVDARLLGTIPGIVGGIIATRPNVRLDRCHLAAFGDWSFDFEAVYYLLSADYNEHMDTQQAILLTILLALERHGIPLAMPTQRMSLMARGWPARAARPSGPPEESAAESP